MNLIENLRTNHKAHFVVELSIIIFLVAAVYYQTVSPMINLWLTSETYSHGILIFPLALYLVYQKLGSVGSKPKSSPIVGVLFILLTGTVWLLATLISINVIQQFTLVALIPCYVIARYGFLIFRKLLGSLTFLFFAVPTGDFLIPHLQQVTADIAIFLVRLTDIPVYTDGLYITIPQANFLVAEACSGIRFLISSFTLGVFYSLLFIEGWKKRLLFMVLSFMVPIVANGIRVFMIVCIAYYIDVESATGFDHIVYGWVFFSVVLILLIYIGGLLSSNVKNTGEDTSTFNTAPIKTRTLLPLIALFLPAVVLTQWQPASNINHLQSTQVSKSKVSWQPNFHQFDSQSYKIIGGQIHQFSFSYLFENEDKELINFNNKLFDDEYWSLKNSAYSQLNVNDETVTVKVSKIVNLAGEKVNIISVYEIANELSSDKLKVKWLQLKHKLLRSDFGGKIHIFSANEKQVPQTLLLDNVQHWLNNR